MNTNIESTILKFLETASALERKLDSSLSMTKGISFSEYRILKILSETNPKGIPRIELAHGIGLTASAVTRALKPLEKLGYVTTLRSKRDARQSLAAITAIGQDLLSDAHGIFNDSIQALPISSLNSHKQSEFQNRLNEF